MPQPFNTLMSDLAITPPDQQNGLGPTLADAWTQNAQAAQQWIEHQRAISAARGLWNDQTGLPTGAGVVDAGQQYAQGILMGSTAPSVRAFHGSPHDFNAFDTSKIGTGEGAQAYGHGLYFAENEGVARGYRDELAGFNLSFPNKAAEELFASLPAAHQANLQRMVMNGAKPAEVKAMLQSLSEGAQSHAASFAETGRRSADYGPDGGYAASEAAAKLAAMRPIKSVSSGHMYEAEINADPEHFLHWDKTLGEHPPAVRDPLLDMGYGDRDRGVDIYSHMARGKEGDVGASTRLAEAGIPGIKYFDQGSRGAGEGTHNFVVFDAVTIDILRKYGLAGLMAGGAATGATSGNTE